MRPSLRVARPFLNATRARVAPQGQRLALALGASAVASSYLTWRVTSEQRIVSFDTSEGARQERLRKLMKNKRSAWWDKGANEDEEEAEEEEKPSDDDVAHDKLHASDLKEGGNATVEQSTSEAFNPETGEINWDCPCLGGMAHGPCGPQFKEAFSCFVHSDKEPKGVDCIEKFKGMQECFREHPDIYGDEIDDDGDDDDDEKEKSKPLPDTSDHPDAPNDAPPPDHPIKNFDVDTPTKKADATHPK